MIMSRHIVCKIEEVFIYSNKIKTKKLLFIIRKYKLKN